VGDESGDDAETEDPRVSRRALLKWGLVGGIVTIAGIGAGGFELVNRGVLPGKGLLDDVDGACDVAQPSETYRRSGPIVSGAFHSRARDRMVAYSVAYPPGHGPGSELPLVVALHGYGATHATAFDQLELQRTLALDDEGVPITPMAIVSADGGNGYWHRHGSDDPLRMLVDELIPRCRAMGLGAFTGSVAAYGWSMGAYGALLLAEDHPELLVAVAATSPAVWTTYSEARGANPGAFSSGADFTANNVITHASRLSSTPVRVDSGVDDPFAPGVRALAAVLPRGSAVEISKGCHDTDFMRSVEPDAFHFLAAHLA